MIMLFLQTLIFASIAFALGCFVGCWLRARMERGEQQHLGAASAITREGAARTGAASELAATTPHYEPATSVQAAAVSPSSAQPAVSGAVADAVQSEPASSDDGTVSGKKAEASSVSKAAPKATGTRTRRKAAAKPAARAAAEADKPAQETKPKTRARAASSKATTAKAAAAKAPQTKAGAEKASAKPAAGAASAGKAQEVKSAPKPETKPAVKAEVAAKTAPKRKAAPKKRAKPAMAAVADDLKQIKGVGPQLEAKLNAIGINSFAQIASWTKKEQAEFGEQLFFSGRVERDDWVAQAKILAKGGTTEFSKRVAKGEVPSSAGGASKAAPKTK